MSSKIVYKSAVNDCIKLYNDEMTAICSKSSEYLKKCHLKNEHERISNKIIETFNSMLTKENIEFSEKYTPRPHFASWIRLKILRRKLNSNFALNRFQTKGNSTKN